MLREMLQGGVTLPWTLVLSVAIGVALSVASVIAGGLLILLALPQGAIRNHYGAWDRCIGTAPKTAR